MKQTTKINIFIIVVIIFILVLGLFALARFFGKQIIQPCMKEGFTDSEIDNLITQMKDPANKKMLLEQRTDNSCDMLVPFYTKPGLVSRIVLKGNNWLHLRDIQIIGNNNTPITDYTMDITGSPKFYLNNAAYDFSQMGKNTFDGIFHSGTNNNVVFTITLKTSSVIQMIMIMNRFNCCWERLNSFTMYGYDAAGAELFSKKLDDPSLSNFKEGTQINYEANRIKNLAFYVISPFGYVSLFVDNICVYKMPIMDVKIADYKRIYLTEPMPNSTWMMSESGQLAVYSESIGNFTEDRWKNARKITIPDGYSIQPTIFPGVVLPAIPTTAPPITPAATTTRPSVTPAATTPTATTPTATTTRPSVTPPVIPAAPASTTTRPLVTPAATTPTAPASTTTRPPVIPTATTPPIVDTITVSQLDNAKTIGANSSNYSSTIGANSSNYSTAYGAITYNI
jgi:hypothetical protein